MVDPTEVLGLYSMNGKVSNTGEMLSDIGFVKISSSGKSRGPFSSIRAEYVEDKEALEKIKTIPSDNKPSVDTIRVNREKYISHGKTEIGVQFETKESVFEIKPSHEKALKILGQYFNLDVLGIVGKGIRKSNEKREFEQLVRKANREIKNSGSPYSGTVRKFEQFIQKLLDKEKKEQKIEKIEGVLFYAHDN